MPGGSDESVDSEPEPSSVEVLGHKRANPSSKSERYKGAKAWKLKFVVPHDDVENIMDLLAEIPKARHQNIDLLFLTAQFDATNIANSYADFDVTVEGFAQLKLNKSKISMERLWMPGSNGLACEWTRVQGGLRGNPDFEAYMSREDPFVTTVLFGELRTNNAGRAQDKQSKLLERDKAKRARSVSSNVDSRSTSFTSWSSPMALGTSDEDHHEVRYPE